MQKVAFLSFPAHGHINPTLGLVQELVRAGFKVLYYASAEFAEQIAFCGAEFRDYGVALPSLDFSVNLVHSTNIMLERSQILYERMRTELAELRPDLIIHDGVCGWAKYLAAFLKIPAVSSISSFAMNESLLKGLQSFGETVSFFYTLFLTSHGKRFFALMEKHNQRLAECGLPVPAGGRLDLVDFSTSPEQLNIVYSPRSWQPQGELFDGRYKFIGPNMTARRQDETFTVPDSGKRPVIYVSMGTIQDKNISQYRTFFDALGPIDAQVVLSAGASAERLKSERIPSNFAVYASVPQLKLLRSVALFVSQGGLNSVNEAMYSGVPMILVPLTGEQSLNARRVREAGAGIVLTELRAKALRSAAEQILRDPGYRRSAEAVAKSFREAAGPDDAVAAIVEYLGSRSPIAGQRNAGSAMPAQGPQQEAP